MEIKKSPKADLENKRGLFLEIGLVVALVLVIGAFAVTPKEHRIEKVDLGYAPVEVEIVEVTREDQKPPEAPKKVDMAVVSDRDHRDYRYSESRNQRYQDRNGDRFCGV